jgi:hypothetical protein
MTRTDNAIYLPPAEEVNNFSKLQEWISKVSNLLNNNQNDVYQDLTARIDKRSNETITGTKTFTSLALGSNMNCNQKQMVSMVIENRTSDPENPVVGQIWIRTDLL